MFALNEEHSCKIHELDLKLRLWDSALCPVISQISREGHFCMYFFKLPAVSQTP